MLYEISLYKLNCIPFQYIFLSMKIKCSCPLVLILYQKQMKLSLNQYFHTINSHNSSSSSGQSDLWVKQFRKFWVMDCDVLQFLIDSFHSFDWMCWLLWIIVLTVMKYISHIFHICWCFYLANCVTVWNKCKRYFSLNRLKIIFF